jgi:hypothetical protein
MKHINKQYSYLLVFTAIAGIIFCSPRTTVYSTSAAHRIFETHPAALCVPLAAIHAEYLDETKSRPESQYTDSFLLESTNAFLLFEAMRSFTGVPHDTVRPDSLNRFEIPKYSVLTHDTTSFPEASKRIRECAARYSVDIVVVPYACSVKQRITQAKGWRNSSGPGYDRPVSFSAATSVHIQIWSKEGQLLYERIGRSDTGKPILYSLLKKDAPKGDIIQFAKKLYAPPLIKSLYASVKSAMRFN